MNDHKVNQVQQTIETKLHKISTLNQTRKEMTPI